MSNQLPILGSKQSLASFLGGVPLISCAIRLTKACDASCAYCYSSSARPMPGELSPEQMLDLIRQLAGQGLLRLFISGGEPTLCGHLCDVIREASGAGVSVSVSTHGGRLTDHLMDEMIAAGLKQLQISLDAPGKLHDTIRGIPGLYEAALSALKRAASALPVDKDLIVATVITKANLNSVEMLCQEVAEAGARTFAVVPMIVTGRARSALAVSVEETVNLLAQLDAYVYEKTSMQLAVLLPPAFVPTRATKGRFSDGYVRAYPFQLAIDANGDVALADIFLNAPRWVLGNVRQKQISEIYNEALLLYPELIIEDNSRVEGVCSRCAHWDICGGGDRPVAYLTTGRHDQSDRLCHALYESGLFPASALMNIN